MYDHSQRRQKATSGNKPSSLVKSTSNPYQLVDNRPEFKQQEFLQNIADNGARGTNLKSFQLIANRERPIQLKSNVTWTTQDFEYGDKKTGILKDTVGKKMEATLDPKDKDKFGGNSTTSKELPELFDGLKNNWNPGSKYWVRGHLLNDHLNGPNSFPNLFPITGHANLDHLNYVESHIKDWIKTHKNPVKYQVEATQNAGKTNGVRNAGAKFDCYATTKNKKGDNQTLYRTIESTPILKDEDDEDHEFSSKKIHNKNNWWSNDNQKEKGDRSNDDLPDAEEGMNEDEIKKWSEAHKKKGWFEDYYESKL